MGEMRIVGPDKARGYSYPVCKKDFTAPLKIKQTLSQR